MLVQGIAFTPKELRTPVGQPVTWKFDDGGLEHTVTADDKSFDSGRMSAGTFPKIFSTAGDHPLPLRGPRPDEGHGRRYR